jgi:hypothetical protein
MHKYIYINLFIILFLVFTITPGHLLAEQKKRVEPSKSALQKKSSSSKEINTDPSRTRVREEERRIPNPAAAEGLAPDHVDLQQKKKIKTIDLKITKVEMSRSSGEVWVKTFVKNDSSIGCSDVQMDVWVELQNYPREQGRPDPGVIRSVGNSIGPHEIHHTGWLILPSAEGENDRYEITLKVSGVEDDNKRNNARTIVLPAGRSNLTRRFH